MRFTLYTLFPGLVTPYLEEGLLRRAIQRGLLEVEVRDLRRFANTPTGRVDDAPYGGGAGMVIRVDVAAAAIAEVRAEVQAGGEAAASAGGPGTAMGTGTGTGTGMGTGTAIGTGTAEPAATAGREHAPAVRANGRVAPPDEVVLLTPAGERLDQRTVERFATLGHVVLLSGRYEGFDARVEELVTRELSIGDYVLMGGELPALVLIEAVARLLPGALGHAESHLQDSFSSGILDHPEYTRPQSFEGREVPGVLLSGDHGKVDAWRREQALGRTLARRPDLIDRGDLSADDEATLAKLRSAGASAPASGEGGREG